VSVPRRGEIWSLATSPPATVLVISSTQYNGLPDEPTVMVVFVTAEQHTDGFFVDLGEGRYANVGRIGSVRKSALGKPLRDAPFQVRTDVNNMLLRVIGGVD
jgi:mRNA-degrading endonuclease toxin of MazEF toxin-antitoxin module